MCSICTGNIKLCVSSREEVVFKKEFGSHPSLRLHHLTAPDIYRYALSQIAEFASQDPLRLSQDDRGSHQRRACFCPNPGQLLAETIVEKYEGVFLWAHLAIKSLERAKSNMDNAEITQKRLEAMPKDLENLYDSMWKRLNDDEELYTAEAVLYFNLVIDYSDQHLGSYDRGKFRDESFEPTLGHISIAREVIDTFERDRALLVSPLQSIGAHYMYTANCKAYVFKSAVAGLQHFYIHDWDQLEALVDEWLKIIEFLLSQGCEPQYSHPPISVSHNTTILELLISLYWKLPGHQQIIAYVKGMERRILEILQKLTKNKLDMNQEVYAIFTQGTLRDSYGKFLERVTTPAYKRREENIILLKLPVGELLRRLSQSMPHTVIGKGIAEFISSWTPQEPEILAIGFGYILEWSKSARRVDKVLEQKLLEVIMREKPPPDTQVEVIEDQIQREIDGLIEGHNYDRVEPEDLTEYLLIDRGLQEKYPKTLEYWLDFVVERNIWVDMEKRRYVIPTKFVSDAEFEDGDYKHFFELLWGSD
ncbi:hypothetical protein HYALB_00002508 [Hymenoscyphus albidus]|uniref:Uncharacterized protein n=1 Tax=Hymenoscyphus albidus TaxID=595503 RepID=A0A9N9Q9F3_9HELO|nr:hypothetical protein HYALB_00002508 [Hymenoscyphus albidus]